MTPKADIVAVLREKPKPSYAPVYAAALYPQLAELGRQHGYALAVHGSLQRDFDLIAVPWVENPSEPQALVDAITSGFAAKEVGGPPSDRPHGRRTWSLSIGFGTCAIDLSFMPMMSGVTSLRDRCAALVEQHGGQRAAARAVNIDEGYFCHLLHGTKDSAGDDTLARIGLRRVVSYALAARTGKGEA